MGYNVNHFSSQSKDNFGLPWPDRVVILRGQLSIIRKRIEQGIPVSIESISRAEELARSLEPLQ
jgi:hypothetical protein